MTEKDFLSVVKEQVRAELGREANETIEKLVNKFRCELGKQKNALIAEMLNRIEILANQNEINQEITFQINIKAEGVEVKHGYWKRQKGRPEAICSECGREVVYQTIDNKWWFENYCPHCGADMRKKEGGNNANEKM